MAIKFERRTYALRASANSSLWPTQVLEFLSFIPADHLKLGRMEVDGHNGKVTAMFVTVEVNQKEIKVEGGEKEL